jgi:hypothetical protein
MVKLVTNNKFIGLFSSATVRSSADMDFFQFCGKTPGSVPDFSSAVNFFVNGRVHFVNLENIVDGISFVKYCLDQSFFTKSPLAYSIISNEELEEIEFELNDLKLAPNDDATNERRSNYFLRLQKEFSLYNYIINLSNDVQNQKGFHRWLLESLQAGAKFSWKKSIPWNRKTNFLTTFIEPLSATYEGFIAQLDSLLSVTMPPNYFVDFFYLKHYFMSFWRSGYGLKSKSMSVYDLWFHKQSRTFRLQIWNTISALINHFIFSLDTIELDELYVRRKKYFSSLITGDLHWCASAEFFDLRIENFLFKMMQSFGQNGFSEFLFGDTPYVRRFIKTSFNDILKMRFFTKFFSKKRPRVERRLIDEKFSIAREFNKELRSILWADELYKPDFKKLLIGKKVDDKTDLFPEINRDEPSLYEHEGLSFLSYSGHGESILHLAQYSKHMCPVSSYAPDYRYSYPIIGMTIGEAKAEEVDNERRGIYSSLEEALLAYDNVLKNQAVSLLKVDK